MKIPSPWLVACMLAAASCGVAPPSDPARFEGAIMGTTYVVQVVDPLSESERIGLSRAVTDVLDSVDAAMSTYRPESELSRFNRSDPGRWFDLGNGTFAVFREAIRISELTGGAFDVTVGPLVRLWGFGSGAVEAAPAAPSPEQLEDAARVVGFRHLSFSDDPPSVRKDVAGVECDLSAIAKGFAVDQVAELLAGRGIENYLVEVGGEVRTLGKNASGEAWRVGIEMPVSGERRLQRTLPLSGLSLATSGDYRNFYERGGERFSHLIDPRSRRPVSHELASVSVVDLTCMRADALASGLLVLGPEDGYELAVREDLAVLFLIRRAGGVIEERATPSFEQLFDREATMEP